MIVKTIRILAFVLAVVLVANLVPTSSPHAQDAKVAAAMVNLKTKAEKLGAPKIDGMDTLAGKPAPAIYFGSSKQNNEFTLVDQVAQASGGIATIFVKGGDEFVRVATNAKKEDGTRAIGTVLDPKGKAIESIKKG